jgi:hypothetical protein
MNDIDERASLVRALIRGERPTTDVLSELARFPWDSDELAILTRADVVKILCRCVDGIFSANDVEDWANGIEMRDDVGLDPDHEELLKEAVFQLANPDINEPVTLEFAKRWIDRLERSYDSD